MINVYHSETAADFDKESRLNKYMARSSDVILNLLQTGQIFLRKVATLKDTNDLDDAYCLTNSIESGWYQNHGIEAHLSGAKSLRSTSVGDVIEKDGVFHVVCAMGFETLDATVALNHIQNEATPA